MTLDGGPIPASEEETWSRATRLGYLRNFREDSMKDRLHLINWLSIQKMDWKTRALDKFRNQSASQCRNLQFATFDRQCIVNSHHICNRLGTLPTEVQSIGGDAIEALYGRISAKLKYIKSLDIAKAKLLHRAGRLISEKYPDLSDCKHMRSMFVSGAVNIVSENEDDELCLLKEFCAASNRSKENEVKYLNWVNSFDHRDSKPLKSHRRDKLNQMSCENDESKNDFGVLKKDSDCVNRNKEAWLLLQEELQKLQESQMLGELEEVMSYHINVSGSVNMSLARSTIASVDAKIRSTIELLRSRDEGVNSATSEGTNSLHKRLQTIHKRYGKELAMLLNNTVERSYIQQLVPVRYAGTGPALTSMRRRHKDVLVKAAAACEEASPFALKNVTPFSL